MALAWAIREPVLATWAIRICLNLLWPGRKSADRNPLYIGSSENPEEARKDYYNGILHAIQATVDIKCQSIDFRIVALNCNCLIRPRCLLNSLEILKK